MLRNDVFDRYCIPHAHPKLAKISFIEKRNDTIRSARLLEKIARKSAGGPGDKVTIHAVEDPSVPNEDPTLAQLSTQSPTALNDGMEYKIKEKKHKHKKMDCDDRKESKDHGHDHKENKREHFQFLEGMGTSTERGEAFYVLLFIGIIILAVLLVGAFVGTKKR